MQAVQLPDADFPELPTSSFSPSEDAKAPKWPAQKVSEKKRQAPQTSWDAAPDSPVHIPAVHGSSTTGNGYDSYQGGPGQGGEADGWGGSGANDAWQGADSGGQNWDDSAEAEQENINGYDGRGGEETSGPHEPAAKHMGNKYTAAASTGNGWGQPEPDQASNCFACASA